MRQGWLFLLLLVCCVAVPANPPPELRLQQRSSYEVAQLEYWQDLSGTAELEQVLKAAPQFRPLTSSYNIGLTEGTYWFRWQVANDSGLDGRWLLEIQYPLLDWVSLYQLSDDGTLEIQQAGDHLPMAQRARKYRNPLFQLNFTHLQSKQLLLRVKTQGSLQLPLMLWSEAAFAEQDHNSQIVFGFYYGMILMMVLYNLLIYLYTHDSTYLLFVGYLLSYGLFQMSLNGLAAEYLWPSAPWWTACSVPVLMTLATLMLSLFGSSFLQLSQMMPRLQHSLRWLNGLLLLTACSGLLFPYGWSLKLGMTLSLIAVVALSVAGFSCLSSSQVPARSFVVAWLLFLAGMLLYSGKTLGLLPEVFVTAYGIQIGSSLQILLLSVALTQKIRLLHQQSARTQAQTQILLEQRVQQRTAELEQTLAELSDAYRRLEEASARDGLTELYNRRYFDRQYLLEWRRALRTGQPLSVLMLDLDHFKWVNDSFGHLAGDDVLRQTGLAIAGLCRRPADLAARYGGEEFILVLPVTDQAGATRLAERLLTQIRLICCQNDELCCRITASIGLVSRVPKASEDPESLIADADQALYRAKTSGRDRLACA